MGEKDGTKNDGETKAAAEGGEKAAVEGGKKDEVSTAVVLKLDLHCVGCAKKVRRSVSNLEGVDEVKADWDTKKLIVRGNVDPTWLRERVESKTKKKVELVSPPPTKDGGSGGAAAVEKAKEKPEKKTEENKADDDKPKTAAVGTVVMKTKLHCDGCAHKIKRIILKNFDGIESVTTDLHKDVITVVGAINVNELVTFLREKLKREVEIVPPKKNDKEGGGDKNGGGAGGGSGGGGEKKKEKESGGDGSGGGDKKPPESGEEPKFEVNKMEHHHSHNPQTHYAMPMYGQSYGDQGYGVGMYHHQGYSDTGYVVQYARGPPPPPPPTYLYTNDHMFSDENPNGCFVM